MLIIQIRKQTLSNFLPRNGSDPLHHIRAANKRTPTKIVGEVKCTFKGTQRFRWFYYLAFPGNEVAAVASDLVHIPDTGTDS